MAKLPQNRYASAREMLDALDTYVQNPSVMFEYQYITEDAPEKVVKRTMNQNKAARQNHPNESLPRAAKMQSASGAPFFCRSCSASRSLLHWPVWPCAG